MKPEEKWWLAAATAIVVLVVNVPYLAGWWTASPDQPFSGVLMAREDAYSYLAKMRLGAGGEWLFQDLYAIQPHPKVPLFEVYLLLGHIAAPGGDAQVPLSALAVTFALARVVFGCVLLVVLYRLIALFVEDLALRRTAWILIVLGGGLGWLMLLLSGEALPYGSAPLDLYMGEANTIVPLLVYPHALLARAALLGGVWCLARADERTEWRWAGAAGLCWLVATFGVPFDILVAGGIVGGWIVARWLITRRFPRRLTLMGLAAGIPGSALTVITLAMIGADSTYASWNAQNRLPLPHVLHLLSAFGPQTGLAIPAVIALWREKTARADLLIGWAVMSPLMTLIPLPFQLRLIEGFAIPAGILAVLGLHQLAAGRARLGATIALFALVLPTSLFLIAGGTASALGGFGRLDRDRFAMLEWLRTDAERGSIVLSSGETGVTVPAAAPLRAVLGHGFETPDYAGVKKSATSFYQSEMSKDEAMAWLGVHHVRYVVVGPDEAHLAGLDGDASKVSLSLIDALPLTQVFASGRYRVYELRSP